MSLPIQKLAHHGAKLITESKLLEADTLNRNIIQSLLIGNNPDLMVLSGTRQLGQIDICFRPISAEIDRESQKWDDNGCFSLPYLFSVRELPPSATHEQHLHLHQANHDKIVAGCAVTCLFNMGLSSQMAARCDTQDSAVSLKKAVCCYERAWGVLQSTTPDVDQNTPPSFLFLMMAVCTKMRICRYQMGDLDASRAWLSVLQTLVSALGPLGKSDEQMLTFFILASVGSTASHIAAGAA
eukprot:CAMPEP_0172463392 /NCGR_PEP_ID=MMETSP1065-20121228/47020_1 /TAXON_ID=265537 /ORGANISM="Amphiprora paludosa, Strain CCMP125" /LENGTH=239 /DNA_ID=CAMNT_0013219323 /DNA_START=197 /DNA_END=916 /DNA_ORIENTATION=-